MGWTSWSGEYPLPTLREGSGPGRELRERNTKSQSPSSREIPESKHQKPSSKHQRNPKFQAPNRGPRIEFGAWSLELLWCLELGVWCFQLGAWSLVFGVFILLYGAWFLEFSFVSQRLHRIDSRCPAGWQPTGEDGHTHQKERDYCESHRINWLNLEK